MRTASADSSPAPVADLIVVPRSRQNAQAHAVAVGTSDITDVDMNRIAGLVATRAAATNPAVSVPTTPADVVGGEDEETGRKGNHPEHGHLPADELRQGQQQGKPGE